MTLTLFILGLLIILLISRYNESNKLFWQLLVAFTLCFAATKIVYNTFFAEKEQTVKKSLNQAYPTQGLTATLDINKCLFTNGSCLATVVETQNLVSQDYTPAFVEQTNSLSYVAGVTQRININILPNPPNSTILYDTS